MRQAGRLAMVRMSFSRASFCLRGMPAPVVSGKMEGRFADVDAKRFNIHGWVASFGWVGTLKPHQYGPLEAGRREADHAISDAASAKPWFHVPRILQGTAPGRVIMITAPGVPPVRLCSGR